MMVGLRLAHFVRRVWHFLDTEWDGAVGMVDAS